jgi:iron complex transport system ATP-binding protein
MSIEARELCVDLARRRIVQAVSLVAHAGSLTVVAGPNGAGKSTLLRALSGLLPPASGDVLVKGQPISAYGKRALGRELAYLPQDRIVHWPVSVRVAVGLGRMPHHSASAGSSREDLKAIEDAMLAMDIGHLAERSIATLSGGERARVLMARALAQQSWALVADEPVSGLDPAHALELFAHLRSLADRGHAVITALHDLSLAARFADQIVLMKDGEVRSRGVPRDVLTAENLAAVYGIRATLRDIDGVLVVLAIDRLP